MFKRSQRLAVGHFSQCDPCELSRLSVLQAVEALLFATLTRTQRKNNE